MKLSQLKASMPARNTRPAGFWLPYAWLVRSIVEKAKGGRVVTDVVRTVLANEGLPLTVANERTLRVAYYGIRDKEWPVIEPEPSVAPEPSIEPETNSEYFTAPYEEHFALDEELRLELEREISEGFIPDPE